MGLTGNATAIVVVSVVFPVIAATFVGLRFQCRRLLNLGFGKDDYWIVVAWVNNSTRKNFIKLNANFHVRLSRQLLLCLPSLVFIVVALANMSMVRPCFNVPGQNQCP